MHAQAEVIQQSTNHTPIVTFSTGSTIYLGACQHQNQPTQFPDVALVITCFGASRNLKHPEQVTDNSSHSFTFNIPPAAEWIECNRSHVPHRHQALTSTLDKIRHHVQQGNNSSIHCMKGTHRAPVICALAISSLTSIPLFTSSSALLQAGDRSPQLISSTASYKHFDHELLKAKPNTITTISDI